MKHLPILEDSPIFAELSEVLHGIFPRMEKINVFS